MAKFLVQNLTKKSLSLGIEPWADVEVLAPDAKIEFDYDEPADVEFAILSDGSASVSVVSDRQSIGQRWRKELRATKGKLVAA